MLALGTGVPVLAALASLALAVLTPWSRFVAERLMVGLLVALAAGALALEVPSVRWGTSMLVLLLAGQTALQVAVALARTHVPLRPQLPVPDLVALVGGMLVAAMLGAPYVGRSTGDVLLDLARGFDAVNHVHAVANLVVAHGSQWAQPSWPSPDGSALVMAGYPLGFHAVIAGALGLVGVGPSRDLVVAYAGLTVLALGFCAAVLGWIAVRIAGSLGSERTASTRALWAAVGYAGAVLLGGGFVAPLVLGHTPFVVAATAGIVASWLALAMLADADADVARVRRTAALARGAPTRRWAPETASLAVLVVGVVGLLGAYPPLAAGLAPGAVIWIWHAARRGLQRGLVLGACAGLVVALAAAVWLWRGRLEHLLAAVGENSTPLLISLILVVLTAGGAWIAWERGYGLAPARALVVATGYLGAGVLLAAAGAARGLAAADSYYGTKLAEAAWLAALPVLVALVAGGVVRFSAAAARPLPLMIPAAGMLSLAVLVGALPVGRTDGLLVGPSVLVQRLNEARRAEGQVRIVEAARLAGPSTGDASAMIEPAGWFHPIAHDDAPYPQWHREAATAALWLATLRGVRTQATDEAANCFRFRGDVSSLACVSRWLAADPGRRITVVVTAGPAVAAVQDWAQERTDRVRIVALPA